MQTNFHEFSEFSLFLKLWKNREIEERSQKCKQTFTNFLKLRKSSSNWKETFTFTKFSPFCQNLLGHTSNMSSKSEKFGGKIWTDISKGTCSHQLWDHHPGRITWNYLQDFHEHFAIFFLQPNGVGIIGIVALLTCLQKALHEISGHFTQIAGQGRQ